MQESTGNIFTQEEMESIIKKSNDKKGFIPMSRMPNMSCIVCHGTGRIRIRKGKKKGLYKPCKCTQ